ncbi:MAG: 7-carboxy-7-deazaguanine synthase [Patiriisocius sp.]|jgi:7-carboxy-7-deazaguanine synthase
MSLNKLTTESFPVMEHFYTIQGEGYWNGTAAYFIRLGGCDVGCSWCDVKESWPMDGHNTLTISFLLGEIKKSGANHVVITGGEPAMYDLQNLVNDIAKMKIEVHIETSGVYAMEEDWHWICLSPKKFKAPDAENHEKAHELKVIVVNKTDFQFAEEHAALVNANCKLFLQPEWSKRDKMMPLIVEYVKENPKWSISLQTHKYLNIP